MAIKCPRCHRNVTLAEVAKHRCPFCGLAVYFSPKWRWTRGLSRGLLTLLITFHWYPLNGTLGRHFLWLAGSRSIFLALLIMSVYLLPGGLEAVPTDGPITLNLSK